MEHNWVEIKSIGKWFEGTQHEAYFNKEDLLFTDGVNVVVGYLDSYGDILPSNVDSGYDMSEPKITFTPTHYSKLPKLPA